MKIYKDPYKKIKSEQKKRKKYLAEALINNKIKDAKENAEWIDLSDKLIAPHKNRLTSFLAIGTGVVCLVIIGLVNTIHIRSAGISLEILADAITFSIDKDWESQHTITGDNFYIDEVHSVSSSFQPSAFKSTVPSSLEITGENIELKNAKISHGAKTDIRCFRNNLNVFIANSGLSGDIPLRKGIITIDDFTDSVNIEMNRPKTTYTFRAGPLTKSTETVRLDIENVRQFELKNLSIKTLNFQLEDPPGSGIFKSTVIHGNITLHDTKKNIPILENENLSIELDKCIKSTVFIKDDKVGIKLLGTATKLKGGPELSSNNYKPTVLEYIYHNQRIALLWSALVFLFGLLWSIKNTVFKK